ncbi:MAG: UDP-2,3-diacylglucosamine diphosphatase LpxI [Planctomycetes bacterium]|nr:UDP-2,3-diacylglucosamine diphosphatase LpxI [Planctomycetota bacterium]
MTNDSDPHGSQNPVGLIAGQGRLPLLVAQGMKSAGVRIVCVGLRDQFDADLPGVCDEFSRAGIARPGRWIRLLKKGGVTQAVMVGGVKKSRMHDPLRLIRHLPDWRAVRLWYNHLRHDRRNAAVLAAIADELARNGITIIDSTTYIPDHLAGEGEMTHTQPSSQQQADIDFAWSLLTQAVELGIGQSMAVRERDVIAVEAVEGTEAMIKRAGELCKAKGWTLLKTAAADHDMRADVPSVGVETIAQMKEAGAGCLALGTGRVILIDKPQVIEAAEKAGIAIVGTDT